LGRRLVEKQPKVKIFGEEYHLRADVQVISGYSAHADRAELLDWFKQVREQTVELEHVFVVHGEKESSDALAEAFIDLGTSSVWVPEPNQAVTV
jgi:metallo-beta-lactamase family protein